MSRSRSDADLLLSVRDAAVAASSAVPSVVGSRHGRSSRGSHRHGTAASLRSRSFTSGSRSDSRSGTSMTRSSTSGGPLCMTLEENSRTSGRGGAASGTEVDLQGRAGVAQSQERESPSTSPRSGR